MAKRSFKSTSWSAAAVADTTNYTNQQFMAIQGGSSTQRIMVSEILVGGLATSSAPSIMAFARDSTVGATLTALTTGESDTAIDPATAALAAPAQVFTQSTTKPQRSATLSLAVFPFNAYGGVIRWVAAPYAEFIILGNTASFGEASLSAYTGSTTANVGAHIIYEPL
jgi:hypothetical protein